MGIEKAELREDGAGKIGTRGVRWRDPKKEGVRGRGRKGPNSRTAVTGRTGACKQRA